MIPTSRYAHLSATNEGKGGLSQRSTTRAILHLPLRDRMLSRSELSSYHRRGSMKILRLSLCFLTLATIGGGRALSQDSLVESSTEKHFPVMVTFTHGDTTYTLRATGSTVRKKLFFKVYAVVHYIDGTLTGPVEARLEEVLRDGRAKELVLDFARDVGSTQIQDAFKDGFAANATAEESAAIGPSVAKFIAFFDREITENSQLTFRWLPGGIVLTEAYGESQNPVTDTAFARVLWSIWFGEDSIVDPEELVTLPDTK